jgi:NAD(P)-dependent dehydrogenase (short-subunit alcohol dehydrogenase family)
MFRESAAEWLPPPLSWWLRPFSWDWAVVGRIRPVAGFAVGKFGLRGLAESMARELHPQGIHVAHFNIDGGIGIDAEGEARLRPDAIAETYYQVHVQHPSAWSHSVEVRPWVEKF